MAPAVMEPLGRQPVPSPAEVEKQLAEFWRSASTDDQAVMRACSRNLIVICSAEQDDLGRATDLVARISRTSPGRALVVSPSRSPGAPGLDVYVSTHCHRVAGGDQVCSEQVTLETGRDSDELLPGTLLQLLVEEMPVYLWWRPGLIHEELLDSLIGMVDYLVVDSATTDDAARRLGRLARLARRESWPGKIVDLAWFRLEPWREAVASFFDARSVRAALDRVARVRVAAGSEVSGAYLIGWFAGRLGLVRADGRWQRRDGRPLKLEFERRAELAPQCVASVRIEAEQDDTMYLFHASLESASTGAVALSVSTDRLRLPTHRIRLPRLDEAELFCGVLQHTGRDALFESSLELAARSLESS